MGNQIADIGRTAESRSNAAMLSSSLIEEVLQPCLVITSDLHRSAVEDVAQNGANMRVHWMEGFGASQELNARVVPKIKEVALPSGRVIDLVLARPEDVAHTYLGAMVMKRLFVPAIQFVGKGSGLQPKGFHERRMCDYILFGQEVSDNDAYLGDVEDASDPRKSNKLRALKSILEQSVDLKEVVPRPRKARPTPRHHYTGADVVVDEYCDIAEAQIAGEKIEHILAKKEYTMLNDRDLKRLQLSIAHYTQMGVTNKDDLALLATLRAMQMPFDNEDLGHLTKGSISRIAIPGRNSLTVRTALAKMHEREADIKKRYSVKDDIQYFDYFFDGINDMRNGIIERLEAGSVIVTKEPQVDFAEDFTKETRVLEIDNAITEYIGEYSPASEALTGIAYSLLQDEDEYAQTILLKDQLVRSGSIEHHTTIAATIKVTKLDSGNLRLAILAKAQSSDELPEELLSVDINPLLGCLDTQSSGMSIESILEVVNYYLEESHERVQEANTTAAAVKKQPEARYFETEDGKFSNLIESKRYHIKQHYKELPLRMRRKQVRAQMAQVRAHKKEVKRNAKLEVKRSAMDITLILTRENLSTEDGFDFYEQNKGRMDKYVYEAKAGRKITNKELKALLQEEKKRAVPRITDPYQVHQILNCLEADRQALSTNAESVL